MSLVTPNGKLVPPLHWLGPVPAEDLETRPFWDALRQHRLSILRCELCGQWIHYPVAVCPECHSNRVAYRPVSGRGIVYSFTVVHREFGLHFDIPWVAAYVDLVEQPALRLSTNIVGCRVDEVEINMPVEVIYQDYDVGLTLAYFRPAPREANSGEGMGH